MNVVIVSVRSNPPANPAVRAANKSAARTGNLNKHSTVKTRTDITIGLKSNIKILLFLYKIILLSVLYKHNNF